MPFGGQTQLHARAGDGGKAARARTARQRPAPAMAWGLQPLHRRTEPVPRRLPGRGREPLPSWWPAGAAAEDAYLTFQEYFERLGARPGAAGAGPWPALLGALDAQVELGVAAIGGKDSMSGSFEQHATCRPRWSALPLPPAQYGQCRLPRSSSCPARSVVLLSPAMARRPAAQCREPEAAVERRWRRSSQRRRSLSAYTPSMGGRGRGTCSRWAWATASASRFAPRLRRRKAVRLLPTAASCWSCAEDVDDGHASIGETTARYVLAN